MIMTLIHIDFMTVTSVAVSKELSLSTEGLASKPCWAAWESFLVIWLGPHSSFEEKEPHGISWHS